MDQAQNLRNIIKLQNQKTVTNARVIAVTSGKGGVGKSNISINIALQFQRKGKKVIILDADFGLANIEVMFGVIPKYNLGDLLFKGKEVKDIITQGPENVGFISGGSGIAKLVNLDKDQVRRLVGKLAELEELADIIIIDTGAGISSSVMEFLLASPEVILVTTPEPTSIADSYALLKALRTNGEFHANNNKIMLVANKVNSRREGDNLYEKFSSVVAKFLKVDIEFLGMVPFDASFNKAAMGQKPVSIMYPNSVAARSFESIVKVMEHGEKTTSNTGIGKFFKSVFTKRIKE